ncbi:ZYRO0G05060p [Zygosaccharomyces rouxii]|uniref:ZYRO0G05060p n=1 Tax=Zygosaccharomyces rouxii (strain ATCC 2623 / CBS 732 / NBRC 1130 / NCYC 568 / NRRL Y-229) TaxID=559307 RepID=C5DZJ9_ZYGRC|nr:uncharacterized protein ZYRO0G05060g [Zygosaccharomyces rouxii]KAH9202282.1 hypothetical protein LQ764DRAFT_5193 [Zygosaccharomyces rouxii]CAR29283.1 ZYRO0G05060p [Zygosaccharomyces rouxii]
MGLDKASIEKRVSRIELDIDHMNQMIDENLKLNEAGDRLEQDSRGQHAEDNQHLGSAATHQGELSREDSVQNSATSVYSEADGHGSITREDSLHKPSGASEAVYDSQEAPVARSEASNDEYYGWSEDQQEQDEQAYTTGQSEADTEYDNEEEDPEETFQAPEERESQEHVNGGMQLHKRQFSEQYPESNDEWEDEVEEPKPEYENENENENESEKENKVQPEATPKATPRIPQAAALPEQETPRTINYETQTDIKPDIPPESQSETHSETQSDIKQNEQELPTTHPYPQEIHNHQHTHETDAQELDHKEYSHETETQEPEHRDHSYATETQEPEHKDYSYATEQYKEVPNPPRGMEFVETREDESLDYSYEPAHQDSPETHKRTIGATQNHNSNGNSLPDTTQSVMGQGTSGEKFSDSLYDKYDDQPGLQYHQELGQEASDLPQARSSVGPYHINEPQNDPYDYSYETFETAEPAEPAPPHTANTSQDSNGSTDNPFTSDKVYERSTSGSTDTDDFIHIPKNSAQRPATTSNTPVTSRRPTNPFRVVSVGVVGPDGRTSRKTSAGTFSSYKDSNVDGPAILQKKLDHLVKKCTKLQREIDYLTKMNTASSLPIEDSRKLSRAVDKLQEYLDKKNKEKYDVGVLLSRQLRREIDRGENGQFWVGTK